MIPFTGDNAGAARTRQALAAALLAAMTCVAYLPAVRGGFVWDDDAYVTQNPTLRTPDGLVRLWFHPGALPQYYPLVHTTFWAEYRLWGLEPLGYHGVNVALHAAAAVLAWRLLRRIGVPGAWLAAAIFAVHPVHVESVAWITERKNVLSMVFYLLAALAYLRFSPLEGEPRRDWRWYAPMLLLFLGALLSKTVTASLPAALLVVVWWKRGRIGRRDVWPLIPMLAIGAAMGLMTAWTEAYHVGARGEEWDLSLLQRVLIAGRALGFYAAKLLWPHPLIFTYPRWDVDAGAWWQYLYPAGAVAAVVALFLLRHRLGRGPLAAVLFFAGTLLPALGFLNVFPFRYSFVADHFQYHASLGLIALGAAAATLGVRRLGETGGRAGYAGAAIALGGLGFLTWQQGQIYKDIETLYADTIQKNPACWMAADNLGLLRAAQGRLREAVELHEAALRIKPHAVTHSNLGTVLARMGRLDEAITHFREGLRLDPNDTSSHYNLGLALSKPGKHQDLDEAIAHYRQAIRLTGDAASCNNLAWLRATHPDPRYRNAAEAVRLAEQACAASGRQDPLYLDTLAAAYAEAGRWPEAVAAAQEAIARARADGATDLAAQIQARLALFGSAQPYRAMPGG